MIYKGGSDTLTKLFCSAMHQVPSVSPAAYAVSHLFRFLSAILYRCDSIFVVKEDLYNYKTLYKWRQAINHRQKSFKHFLQKLVYEKIQEWQVSVESDEDEDNRTVPRALFHPGRRSRNRPSVIPVPWGNEITGKTPQKTPKKRYEDGTVDSEVAKRRKLCKGNLVFKVDVGANGEMKGEGENVLRKNCVECGARTRFYCIDCHHPLCGPSIDRSEGSELYRAGKIHFRVSCFHKWHELGLNRVNDVGEEDE